MKTITIKERIDNFERVTYKPGVYEVVKETPADFQMTEETAKRLKEVYPDRVKASGN